MFANQNLMYIKKIARMAVPNLSAGLAEPVLVQLQNPIFSKAA